MKDGGTVQASTAAGDVEAVADQVAAGAFDRVVGEKADASFDALAPSSAQLALIGLSGDLGGGAAARPWISR
ncbi:MAG: hypothetical protein ACJ736_30245 [Streptomyces sp.]